MRCSRTNPLLPLVLALVSCLLAAPAPEALAASTTTSTTTTTLPPQNEMWVIPSVGTSRQSIGNWEATNQQDAPMEIAPHRCRRVQQVRRLSRSRGGGGRSILRFDQPSNFSLSIDFFLDNRCWS